MARQFVIRESVSQLEALVERYRGLYPERPLRMLLLFKRSPLLRDEAAAQLLGCSSRSIRRWRDSYAAGGLSAFIGNAGDDHHLSAEQVLELRSVLSEGVLESIEDVRRWLHERHGLQISTRGVSGILSRLGARRIWMIRTPEKAESGSAHLRQSIISFANSFAVDSPPHAWSAQLTERLAPALPDVDRIGVAINMTCDFSSIPGEERRSLMALFSGLHEETPYGAIVPIDAGARPEFELQREFRKRRYPLARFHPPQLISCHHRQKIYLATLILWRDRSKRPVSQQTLRSVTEACDVLSIAFTDYLAIRTRRFPTDHIFLTILNSIASDARLTPQELRVLVSRLLGRYYKEIADEHGISEDTVKKTLQRVYRKTGTSGSTDLFAKYFGPHLGNRSPV